MCPKGGGVVDEGTQNINNKKHLKQNADYQRSTMTRKLEHETLKKDGHFGSLMHLRKMVCVVNLTASGRILRNNKEKI